MSTLLDNLDFLDDGISGLYLDGSRIISTALVSLEDILELRYNFSIEPMGLLALYNQLNVPVTIPIDENLKWVNTHSPFMISVQNSDGIFELAVAEVINGVASITFAGSFWDQYTIEDLAHLEVEMAYFILPCRLSDIVSDLKLESCQVSLLDGQELLLYVNEHQKSKHKLDKNSSAFSNNRAVWTINYTPGAVETEYPIRLTDTWDNDQHILIAGSISAMRGEEDIIDLLAINHESGESSITLVITEFSPNEITISYETRLADSQMTVQTADDLLLTNTATLIDNDDLPLIDEPVNATVDVYRSNRIMSAKSGTQSGRFLNWTLTFNLHDRIIIGDSFIINDAIPSGMLIEGAVAVTDTNGSGVAHSLTISDEKDYYNIIIAPPFSDVGYKVTFSTGIDSSYFDGSTPSSFTNTGNLYFDWVNYNPDGTPGITSSTVQHPTVTVPFESRIVAKSGTYNRSKGEITWTITVNPYQVDVDFGMITEDLTTETSYPTTYVADSFYTTSSSDDINLISVSTDQKLLLIDVGKIGKSIHTFTFKAKLDNPDHYAGNFDYEQNGNLSSMYYYNTISFEGNVLVEGSEEEPLPPWEVSTTYRGSAPNVTSRMLDKAAVSYDINERKATWSLVLNKNNMDMTDVLVTDMVATGQMFVAGSVLIDGATPDPSVEINYNGADLEIIIPVLNLQTTVTYQTLIDPDVIDCFKTDTTVEISNSATLKHAEGPTDGLTQTSSVEIANQIVSKSGTFIESDKLIRYTVNINPNNMTFPSAYLYDEIPDGLQLDINSVTLYHATVNAIGEFSKGTIYYAFDNPAFTYTIRTFSMRLPANGRYVLEFDCYITSQRSSYTNLIELRDDFGEIQRDPAESDCDIDIGSGGTGVSSKRVKLIITKVDKLRPALKLSQQVFNLYQKIATNRVHIMTSTTENGAVSFYPLKNGVDYILEESSGSSGYTPIVMGADSNADITITDLTDTEFQFVLNRDGYEVLLTVSNAPVMGHIEFTKTTDRTTKGDFLPMEVSEATFRFQDLTPLSSYTKDTATDINGKIIIDLPFGLYTVTEVVPLPAYHTTSEAFQIEIDTNGNVSNVPLTVQNVYYRPDFFIHKTDAKGMAAADVQFELCDSSGQPFETPVTAITNSSGVAVFEDLYGGESYQIKEIPIEGYYLQPNLIIPTVNQAEDFMPFEWTNFEYDAKLKITKVDSMRTGVKLSGAVFELYATNPEIDLGAVPIMTLATLLDGTATFAGLALNQDLVGTTHNNEPPLLPKTYWLVETIAAIGYDKIIGATAVTLDPSAAGVANPRTFTYTKQLVNEPTVHYPVQFSFTKYTTKAAPYVWDDGATLNTIMPNIRFVLEDCTPGSDYSLSATSNYVGVVEFENIPFGTYLIKEVDSTGNRVAAQYHHALPNIYVTFDIDGICTSFNGISNPVQSDLIVIDEIFTPDLIITKTNAAGTRLPGIGFELCKEDGASFSPAVLSSPTDSNGQTSFSRLVGGDYYTVKEIGNPLVGYYKTGVYQTPIINQATDYAYTWKNYDWQTALSISVVDSMRTKVVLSNSTFEFYRDDGSETGPNTLTGYVGTLTTNSSGVLIFESIEMNQDETVLTTSSEPDLLTTIYWLVQTEAKEGYLKITEPIKVVLDPNVAKSASQLPRTYTYRLILENEPEEHHSINLEFTKFSNKEKSYTLGRSLLPGVAFTMVDQTPQSDLVRYSTSDTNGVVEFNDIPFGTYRIYEDAPALYHRLLPYFEVVYDEEGNCTLFNGISDPESVDFVIVDEVYVSTLIIKKTMADGVTPLADVVFELYDDSENSLGRYATTNSMGEATFTDLYGGDLYTIKEVGNPLPGYYQTGMYSLFIDKEMTYTCLWRNFEYDASVVVTVVDAFNTTKVLADATIGLYESNVAGTCPKEPALCYITTNEFGQAVFTGLILKQDLASLTINQEPIFMETIYWVIQRSPADGYFLNSEPVPVVFSGEDRTATLAVQIKNESKELPLIKLEGEEGKVLPGQPVLFRRVISENGKILYNRTDGTITLNCTGFYFVNWFVAPQCGLSRDRNNFALVTRKGPYTAGSHFAESQTKGVAIIEASDPKETIKLVNVSNGSVTLSKKAQVNAAITIMKMADIPQPVIPMGGIQVQLGNNEVELSAGQPLIFRNIIVPSVSTAKVDYDPVTGYFSIGRGVFLVKWEFPVMGTDLHTTASIHLKATTIENTWVSYSPLPKSILDGSALVVNYQPMERLQFCLSENSDDICFNRHSNVFVAQVHDFPILTSCL